MISTNLSSVDNPEIVNPSSINLSLYSLFISYLCLCLSYMISSSYISLAKVSSAILQGYNPNLISPFKNSISFCSGIKSTIGYLVSGYHSVPWAPSNPSTFLAYSITANCIPSDTPKHGRLFSLAYLIADIFASTPLTPNPPGTNITPTFSNNTIAESSFTSSACTQCIFTSTPFSAPEWIKDSTIEI